MISLTFSKSGQNQITINVIAKDHEVVVDAMNAKGWFVISSNYILV